MPQKLLFAWRWWQLHKADQMGQEVRHRNVIGNTLDGRVGVAVAEGVEQASTDQRIDGLICVPCRYP